MNTITRFSKEIIEVESQYEKIFYVFKVVSKMFQELAPARSSNILSIAESHGEDVLHPPKSKTLLPSEASAIALELDL